MANPEAVLFNHSVSPEAKGRGAYATNILSTATVAEDTQNPIQSTFAWDSISSIDVSHTPHNWGRASVSTEERILPPLISTENTESTPNSPVTLNDLRQLAPFIATPELDEASTYKRDVEVHIENGVSVERITAPESRRSLIENDETMIIRRTEYNPEDQTRLEVIMGQSNGRIGRRKTNLGAQNPRYHRPETYYSLHAEDEQSTKTNENEEQPSPTREIVCMPIWAFQFNNGYETFNIDLAHERGQIKIYELISNGREGTVTERITWEDSYGHITDMEVTEFLSQQYEHVGAMRFSFTCKNYSTHVEASAGFNANIQNAGGKLLETKEKGGIGQNGEAGVYLISQSHPSERYVAMASNMSISSQDTFGDMAQEVVQKDEEVMQVIKGRASQGQTITFDRVVSLRSQYDVHDAIKNYKENIALVPNYDELYARQQEDWMRRWEDGYIHFEGDERAKRAQLATNFNRYQQMQHAPRTSRETLTAKGLLGHKYHGHTYWDVDLFNHVPNIYTEPEIALKHLEYRYAGRQGALRKAQAFGYTDGELLYAWEAADDQHYPGEEVTPDVVENPDKTTGRVYTHKAAIHINAAVTWGAWKYWEITGDQNAFLMVAEIALGTAKFYVSKIKKDYIEHNGKEQDLNNITSPLHVYGVLEPDEYHEHSKSELEKKAKAKVKDIAYKQLSFDNLTEQLSDLDTTAVENWKEFEQETQVESSNYEMKVGIDDGDYTNLMIIDNLQKAIKVMEMAKTDETLRDRLGLTLEAISNMQYEYEQIANNIYVPFVDSEKTVHEPFPGYKELSPMAHEIFFPGQNEVNLEINRRHGKPDLLTTMKQDGTLLAHYLLGVRDMAQWRRDVDYQMPHNSKGSSLTWASQVIAAYRAGYLAKAEDLFYKAGFLDLVSKSTTEGPHMASMGGYYQALINGLLDVHIKNGELISENPYLLPGWDSVSFVVKSKGRPIQMTMHRSGVEIAFEDPDVELPVNMFGSRKKLNGSGHHFFPKPYVRTLREELLAA